MAKADNNAAGKRAHKATYARDKKTGGYIIRIQGPHAAEFAGRTVPVVKKDDSENPEQLTKLIWTGTDDGKISNYIGPVALYHFEQKAKAPVDEIPF